MDWLADQVDTLAKQASELTMYDIKSAVNKAKNMVLNLSEIEAKVREATNDDTWGASSTLMQEIAQATFNFQLFNEIMPTIYGRFTEKEARQWRQIYKALVLLEYLIKNGSERVVDDARSHLSLIKVLRNFHYIDENGKDQGINVRNRSKELAELLQDLDKVRQERRKAKQNRNKYTGVGNDGFGGGGGAGGGMSFTTSTGSRYGGFGSDSLESGGGGYSGSSGGFRDTRASAQDFEEYDAGEWEDSDRRRGAGSSSSGSRANGRASAAGPSRSASKPTPPPPKTEPPKQEVNLFDFDDDEQAQPSPTPPPKFEATMPNVQASAGDDDFDDFQSASGPASPVSPPTTQPAARAHQNVFDLLNAQPAQSSASRSSGLGKSVGFASAPAVASPSAAPSYSNFAPMQAQPAVNRPVMSSQGSAASVSSSSAAMRPMSSGAASGGAKKPAAASDFSDLFGDFAASSSSSGANKPAGGLGASGSTVGGAGAPKMTLAQIQQQKAQDKLFASSYGNGAGSGASFGAGSVSQSQQQQQGSNNGWDSLL